jgi:ATP-dependent Lon protease
MPDNPKDMQDDPTLSDFSGLEAVPERLPVLPLRDTVVFPMAIAPLAIGQERSIRLVEEVMRSGRLVTVVAQRYGQGPARNVEDLFQVGSVCVIHQLLRAPDGSMRIILQGLTRAKLEEIVQTDPYFVARLRQLPESNHSGIEVEALSRAVRELFVRLVALIPELPNEFAAAVDSISDPLEVIYQIASTAPLNLGDRQDLLELNPVPSKFRKLIGVLQHEVMVREIGHRLADKTREEMGKAQKEYFLREQMRTIQRELGEEEDGEGEFNDLRKKLASAGMPEEAEKEAQRELRRLERLPEVSPEHGMIRTYLEWMTSLPWSKTTGGDLDVGKAKQVLDEDHYDLEKIKDRLLEYLAVKKLREDRLAQRILSGAEAPVPITKSKGDESRREPLLCLIGAPGVGKTSLGQSIAKAMGRKFVRISLGGIHDEAEIRGHRRTYIGAMPGRILQAIRRAETADPVFMLDEVDKLGVGFHGDPAAALLEVLDPAQNHAFVDTYLGVSFDLSQVLFVCTANMTETIPPALLDRLEVIALPGYVESEKLEIARRFLFPRGLKASGLQFDELQVEDDLIRRIVHDYTREAGVRNLERNLTAVIRKMARKVAEGAKPPLAVIAGQLPSLLGPPRYFNELAQRIDRPGVATGLAWTPAGGEILFVEATMMPSQEEKLILTGMLGEVMRESAQAALSYLRANLSQFGVQAEVFQGKAIHVHVPAGATPKDGPSAGLALVAALASLAVGKRLPNDVGMTGEITLRGKVLPVGGVREKVLAAYRAGVRRVLFPQRNQGDLEEVPAEVRNAIHFVPIDSVEEAIADLFTTQEEKEPVGEAPTMH